MLRLRAIVSHELLASGAYVDLTQRSTSSVSLQDMTEKPDNRHLNVGAEPQAALEASRRSMELSTLRPRHVYAAQEGNVAKRTLWMRRRPNDQGGLGRDAGFHKRVMRLDKGDYNWRLTHEGVSMPGT